MTDMIKTTFKRQDVILIRGSEWWKAYRAKNGKPCGKSFYQADSRASAENFTITAKKVWEAGERLEREG